MSAQQTPLLIRDLMTVGVPTCSPDTPLDQLACLFLENDLEGVVVLDEEGHAIGVVTQEELVIGYNNNGATAENVMREDVPQLPPDIPMTAAAHLMRDMNTRVVFLTHHAGGIVYPAALLSYRHIIRHLAAGSEGNDLPDLGIKAERQSPVEAFIQRRDTARKKNTS